MTSAMTDFDIVNFLFFFFFFFFWGGGGGGNVPRTTTYAVNISQLIRFASVVSDEPSPLIHSRPYS